MRYLKAWAWVLAAMLVGAARGQRDAFDFCAVQLSVTDYYDRPLVSGLAELIDPSGRVAQTAKVADGRAEFCDFGFGEHSIFVHDGRSRCAATEIRNVHVMYGITQKLRVVLNFCADEGDGAPGCSPAPCSGGACFAYIRVISPDGQPVKGAEIKDERTGHSEYADSYGRAGVSVPQGAHTDFTFTKPGYQAQHLLLSCPLPYKDKQALVMLQPEDHDKR